MSNKKYLDELEEKLEGVFKHIKIISEVNLGSVRYNKLMKIFHTLCKKGYEDQEKYIKYVWALWPKTCLVVTVNFAIYNYDGNMWEKFQEELHLKDLQLWKVKFLAQIKKERLVVFNEGQSFPYVHNVLGHAGIPKHNMHEFIKKVIDPAVANGLDVEDIIAAVKRGKNEGSVIKTYGLYKSVKDFIKLENKVSHNLLARCLEVWNEQEKPFKEVYKKYLPAHFLEEFDTYAEIEKGKIRAMASRMARPVLKYSPEYQNVFIHLPAQHFPTDSHQKVTWIIKSSHEEKIISADKYRYENGEIEFVVKRKNGEHPVQHSEEYTVFLFIDEMSKGEWHFELRDYLVFNNKNNEQIKRNFITMSHVLMIVDEKGRRVIEEGENHYMITPLGGEWNGFYEMDLFLETPEVYQFEKNKLHVNPLHSFLQIKGELLEHLKADQPVLGRNLMLEIDRKVLSKSNQFSKWFIRVFHAHSKKSVKKLLKDCEYNLTDQEISVPFHQFTANFPNAFGKFAITLTGMLGHDDTVEFYFLPADRFNLSFEEQYLKVTHTNQYDLTVPSVMHLEKIDGNSKSLQVMDQYAPIHGQVVNQSTKEAFAVKIFPFPISVQLKTNKGWFSINQLFEKTEMDLKEAYCLLDLENPSLQKNHSAVKVELYEVLKNGERALKKYSLRTGRKHTIDLRFFAELNNTMSKRIVVLEVKELNVKEKMLEIDTDWKVTNFELMAEKVPTLKWQSTSAPESIKITLWKIQPEQQNSFEYIVPGSQSVYSLTDTRLSAGYYLAELNENQEEDVFAFLDFDESTNSFPSQLTSRCKLIKLDPDQSLPDFVDWLFFSKEEWNKEELHQLMMFLQSCENIFIPLLLQQYEQCCDFGLQNIEALLEIAGQEKTNPLFSAFLLKMSGFQEWDVQSFAKMIESDQAVYSADTLYAPGDVINLAGYSRRERALSYQRTKKAEQCIKGFSMKHMYLSFLDKADHDHAYKEKTQQFMKKYALSLEQIISDLRRKKLITNENFLILNQRKLSKECELYRFPYYLGLVAYVSALTHYAENEIGWNTVVCIRRIVPHLFTIEDKWFLHDLVYWKQKLNRDENQKKKLLERRKKHGHPSFAWKK